MFEGRAGILALMSGLLTAVATFAFSGYENTGGELRGLVTDTTGAALPGAVVTVAGCGRMVDLESDRTGNYKVRGLIGGRYTLVIQAGGFTLFRRDGIRVIGGRSNQANASLTVKPVSESITVRE